MDLRAFKVFRFNATCELETSVDFNNLTNNNVAWDARSLSGTINLRQNGDPNGVINTVLQFGSPSSVLGPRNIRFNVAFRFQARRFKARTFKTGGFKARGFKAREVLRAFVPFVACLSRRGVRSVRGAGAVPASGSGCEA
jgi:hypothetical protein